MVKAKAKVWCRDCGKKMKQYPYGILAFSCEKCGLKAEVRYSKMPIIATKEMGKGGVIFVTKKEHKELHNFNKKDLKKKGGN